MKKILSLMFTVAILAIVNLSADPLSYSAGDYFYEWELDSVLAAGVLDTLAATDSATICTKYRLDPGYEYVIQRGVISGTGSDSVRAAVNVDIYNLDTSTVSAGRVAIDTLDTLLMQSILIPVGSEIFARKVTIKLHTYTGAGTQAIINKVTMWKRRPIQIQKRY